MGWHGPTHGISHTHEHGVAHNSSIFGASNTTATLGIADSASPTPAGANFNYTVTFTNTGSNAATSVSVAVTLDASLTYVSSSGTGWSISQVGQVVTATAASLGLGAANAITITVTAGNSTATVTTTGAATGSNFTEADATHNTSVVRPSTSVTLTDAADPVIGGSNVVYNSTFTNSGAGQVNNITATFTLDNSLTFVSATGTGWTIGHTGQTVTATLASLGVASANAIQITATSTNSTALISSSVAVTADNANTANASQSTQINAVSKDATSGIYVPASSTEWTNLGLTAPADLYLCQEASGNLADSIGSVTLTASGSPGYQQAVSGWTRKAVTFVDATANQKFLNSTTAPNAGSTSIAMLVYMHTPSAAPAAVRSMFTVGSTCEVRAATTAKVRIDCQSVNTDGTSTTFTNGNTRPILLVYDRTNTKVSIYTDQETFTGTYSAAVTGVNVGIGASGATPPTQGALYAAIWSGANAEALSTVATAKSLLTTLGWTLGY